MGLWERLESVIKSYVNDSGEKISGNRQGGRQGFTGRNDPDFDAAYEELNDFLGADKQEKNKSRDGFAGGAGEETGKKPRPVPEEIRRDFAELGLSPESTAEQCKEVYKKLLKIHHPDRHAGHEGNMNKATEKSARVNAAYDRLEKWFRENK
jgi:DnaJ-domain-containing protein 1